MTIFGWDMSHFDAPSTGTAVDDGLSFITHKAGGDSVDVELDNWWAGVRNLPVDRVLLGAYWVLYPGNPAGRADAFIARLDAVCAGWRDRPWILQVDCERWNNSPATVPSRAEIKAFCDRLVELMPRLRPIVYAPEWVYHDTLRGLGYPLWASDYVTGSGSWRSLYPGDGSSRWGAFSGQVPAILQYTSHASIGGQSTCDANAFRGTFDELVALVAPGWSDDMPLSSDDITKVAKAVWTYQLDIDRGAAGANLQPAGGILAYSSGEHHDILDAVGRTLSAVTSDSTADATRDTALAANLAALPGAVRAELEDAGGPDAAAVEAAVSRALARLQLVVGNPAQ